MQRFACLFETATGCVSENPFNAGNIQLTIVCAFSYKEICSLRGSQTRVHEHFRWSQTRIRNSIPSLAPVSEMYKSPPNISSRFCHWALWPALQSQGRRPSMLPGGGIFCKKTQIYFSQGEYGCYGSTISVFTRISVFTSISVSMLSRNLGKTWQHRFMVGIGKAYACRRPTHASFFRHACMLIPIWKRNMRACLTVWWNLFYFEECHL